MFLTGLLDLIQRIRQELSLVLELQQQIEGGLERMTAKADELNAKIDEAQAKIAVIRANVDEAKGDVQEVVDILNGLSGQPTPAELDDITARLSSVVADLGDVETESRAAADVVPEPEA